MFSLNASCHSSLQAPFDAPYCPSIQTSDSLSIHLHSKMPRLARREQLSSQWTFKQTDDPDESWLPVARVPTVSHIDLIDNGR
jgi:hypothetical protein